MQVEDGRRRALVTEQKFEFGLIFLLPDTGRRASGGASAVASRSGSRIPAARARFIRDHVPPASARAPQAPRHVLAGYITALNDEVFTQVNGNHTLRAAESTLSCQCRTLSSVTIVLNSPNPRRPARRLKAKTHQSETRKLWKGMA
ncbi:hypothetical protein EVAR_38651_1 [Eumeta japonica]|uniref:Uncharacterized protein n=1 Tax=Eumeta variegata TaxID=151549 RepID=A0A4C1Y0C4_EUMVA|nr:hypothetical protein EVAR_38651_1 [Eumeta japonica]